ncbi:MAG: pitrilysin family protein [Nanoarchaeota archaeon]
MIKLTLDNGIPLNLIKTKAETIGFGFSVKIGSAFEEKEKRGISHFLEHMLFKSNKRYKAEEINKTIELSGGKVNAFTDRDITAFLFEVVPEGFEKALDIFYNMFINDKYKEDEFKTEKEVVKSEITIYESNPSYKIYDLAFKSLFGESDLGEPIVGTIETINNVEKEDLEEFKANYYTTDNIELFLVGNFKDKHINLIKNTFGKIEESKSKKKKEPTIKKGQDIVEKMETNNIFAILGFLKENKNNKFLNYLIHKKLISNGLSSLLFNELREKEGFAYSINLSIESFNINGKQIFTPLLIFNGLNKDKKDIFVKRSLEVLNKKKFNKDYIEGRKKFFKLNASHYDFNMFSLVENIVYYKTKGYPSILELKEEFLDKTPEEIRELVEKSSYDNYKLAMIEPK